MVAGRANERGYVVGGPAAESPSRPLIHIPAYVPLGTRSADWDGTRDYVLELLLVALHGSSENDPGQDLLITSNDPQVVELAGQYCAARRRRFEVRCVTAQETADTFRLTPEKLAEEMCSKLLCTKFYPIVRRLAPWIVHLDMDTMVMSPLVFGPSFDAPIALVDANRFAPWPAWSPSRERAEFFGLPRGRASRWKWLNSGVFSVRGAGFELCQAGVFHLLSNLERALALGMVAEGDEALFNALAVRESDAVAVSPDPRDHLLAYALPFVPSWRRDARLIHFHSLKPNIFTYENGRLAFRCSPASASRITPPFSLAALMWCRSLHEAASLLGLQLPTMRRMPAERVDADIERMSRILATGDAA